MSTSRPLLLADIPWLLYRSYFALPKSIADAEGNPVNALLGTVNALVGLITGEQPLRPRAIVACLGAEEAAYRVRLYPPYHAHRDPMPQALRRQWDLAPQLLGDLGWILSGSDDLEADDVMFSHARLEEQAGGSSLLLTADRDLYGAVTSASAVLELGRGGARGTLGPAEVRERYGIEPALVPDLIALRGDPSDGIPGAPGVGAKTAAALLAEHGSLEAVLAAARDSAGEGSPRAKGAAAMRPRTAAALLQNEALLLDFKRIATLQLIAVRRPVDTNTDFAGGAAGARRLGMRRLAERLQALAEEEP